MDIGTPKGMSEAKKWMEAFLRDQLAEGGVWSIPRTAATYKFYQSKKTAVLLSEGRDHSTERVLKAIGYVIII